MSTSRFLVTCSLFRRAARRILFPVVALVGTPFAAAQTVSFTWVGTTADVTQVTNWLSNTAPAGTGTVLENVVIDGNSGGSLTIPVNLTLNSLIFNSGRPNAFIVSGSGSPTLTLTGDIPVAGAGDIALASSVAIALKSDGTDNAHTIDIAQAGTTVSILANVGETGSAASVTKNGSGQLQLQGTNSFTGGLTSNAGVVQLVGAGARAAGTWTFNNASMLNVDVTNGLSVAAETVFNNSSRLNATQPSAVSGGTQSFTTSANLYASAGNSVSGGAQNFYNNSYLVAQVGSAVSGGTQRFYETSSIYPNATNSITGVTLYFYANSYMIVGAADALSTTTNLYFNGSQGGTSGSVSLRGNNTNVGYISSGFTEGSGGLIRNDSTTAATLSVNFAAGTHTFSGSLQNGSVEAGTPGALSLSKNGSGTLVLSGSNTYTGATTINGGRLELDHDSALSSATAVSLTTAGAALDVTHHTITVASLAGVTGTFVDFESAGELITAGNASTSFAGTFNGPTGSQFKKGGSGTLTLSSTGSFLGELVVDDGTVEITVANAFNSGVDVSLNNDGVLEVDQDQHIRGLSSSSSATNVAIAAGKTLKVDLPTQEEVPMTTTYGGTLTGSGALLKWGPGQLTLGGSSSTYTGAITVGSGTLEITHANALGATSAGTTVDSPGTLKLTDVTSLAEPLTFAGSGGTAALIGRGTSSITGSITFNGSSIVNVPTGELDVLTISGAIGQNATPQSLTKTGNGTLVLSGANTFTGTTNLNGGTLQLGTSTTLQNTTVHLNTAGAGLSFGTLTAATLGGLSGAQDLGLLNTSEGAVALTVGNNNAHTTYTGILSGSGSLIKSGNGSLTLGGASTYGGLTTINSGTVIASHATALGAASAETRVNTGGTLTLNGITTTEPLKLVGGGLSTMGSSTLSGAVTLSGSGIVSVFSENALTLSGAIGETDGAATLAKNGFGTLTLSGANTYTGATNVNDGTLIVSNSSALGTNAGATAVNSGAKLKLVSTSLGAEPVTLAGGSLAASGISSFSGPLTLSGFGSIDVGDDSVLTVSGAIGETGGTRNLTKAGVGTLVLSGSSNYTGFTTISEGTLRIGTTNALPTTTKLGFGANALLQVQQNQTIKAFQGLVEATAQIVIDAGRSLTVAPGLTDGSGGMFNGSISGDGSLVINGINSSGMGETFVAGTFVGLTGTNTHGGGTVLNGGTLQIGNASTSGSIAGNITNNGFLLFSRTDGLTYNGVISGSGNLSFNSGGTYILTAPQTYTGHTFVSGGTVRIGVTNALPVLTNLTLGSTSAALDVQQNQTVKTLWSDTNASVTIASGKTLTIAPPVAPEASRVSSYFGGVMSGSGTLHINAADDQEVVLYGASPSFSGNVTVSQGLLVAANNQALGTAAVTVSGGILATPVGVVLANSLQLNSGYIGGSGSFTAPASIGANVIVAPENVAFTAQHLDDAFGSVANLGFTNLTLAGGGTYALTIQTGVNADRINVSSTLTLDGSLSAATPFTFKLGSPGTLSLNASQSWTVITAGSIAGDFQISKFAINTTDFHNSFGGTFSLSQSGSNILLNFTPVPEPSTWALMIGGGGALAIVALRRRRRSRA